MIQSDTLPPGGQQRRHARVPLSADQAGRAQFAVVSPTTGAVTTLADVQAVDLSLGGAGLRSGPDESPASAAAEGLRFTSTHYLSEGAEVRLTIRPAQPAGGEETVTITGQLVRVRGLLARNATGELTLHYRYGVQFAPDSAASATRALAALET
ncbi:MAG: PilZ domain-containing protein [Chloroflexota bacterium]|nr:PilZ domain-containing protein [Chloroflexota bacterium]